MPHPKKEEVYPVGTVVRILKTGEFAMITNRTFLNERDFLHYLAIIEGREGKYCLLHDEIELEALPPE